MVSSGPMPKAIEAAFHISMQAALSACGSVLAAPLRGRGEPVPAGGGPGGIGCFPARRRGDGAVLERRAVVCRRPVERRDHVGGEAAGFLQHRVDGALVEIAIKPLGYCVFQPSGVFERESDVGNRGTIGHAANLAHERQAWEPVFLPIAMRVPAGVDRQAWRRYGPPAPCFAAAFSCPGFGA